ncbi:endoplasmic reticulum resident protein 29-like [Oppia nitens]|uniref:endoplasmic reticulum resident protein 29-like n=1 Tax=Oppia nitens TaxID=1686743 RepID=UPI0023DA87D3|nr:endoplasmic reticulum resident protein 29-like [Oppia nitens]
MVCISHTLTPLVFLLLITSQVDSSTVLLDSITFDKIIAKFKTAVIKFDIPYPYGEKHEEFQKVAKLATNSDLLMAEVGVNEFADKQNLDLAKRFAIIRDDFPVLLLFNNGNVENGIRYNGHYIADDIKRFVRYHSGIKIPLNMCLEELDVFAEQFMDQTITNENRLELLEQTKQQMKQMTNEEHHKLAQIYVQIMEKILQNGNVFIQNEIQRLNGIVLQKMTNEKRDQIKGKINILFSFVTTEQQSQQKSEL